MSTDEKVCCVINLYIFHEHLYKTRNVILNFSGMSIFISSFLLVWWCFIWCTYWTTLKNRHFLSQPDALVYQYVECWEYCSYSYYSYSSVTNLTSSQPHYLLVVGVGCCIYACMHVSMYAYMHVCMYACIHICKYACMHKHFPQKIHFPKKTSQTKF